MNGLISLRLALFTVTGQSCVGANSPHAFASVAHLSTITSPCVDSINVQLAKIATLGERVEEPFLIDGFELQHNKMQIEITTGLLEALAA